MLDQTPEGFVCIDDRLYKVDVLTAHVAYKMWKVRARRKKLLKLYHQQDGVCPCCLRKMYHKSIHGGPSPERSKKRYATVEHILPVSQGGTDEMTNLAATCHLCNSQRGTMDFEAFKALRSKPGTYYLSKKRENSKRKMERMKRSKEKKAIRDDLRIVAFAWLSTLIPGLMESCLEESYG